MSGRSRRLLALVLELLVPVLLVGLWMLATSSADSFYWTPPDEIAKVFRETWLFDRFGSDVVPSLARLGVGYLLAVAVAIAAGVPIGLSRPVHRAVAPVIEFLRALPPPALIPVVIVVVGTGDLPKVILIAFVCIWPILLNTVDAISRMDGVLTDTARVYRMPVLDRLRFVVLPAASPQILAGMRTSLSLAVIMMVISEMVASTNGIGYFVLQSQRLFAIPEMWSGIVLIGILGFTLNALFVLVERRILRWHHASRLEIGL